MDPIRNDGAKGLRSIYIRDGDVIDELFSKQFQLFEGEADPTDPSHFTIRGIHGYRGKAVAILDGWLLANDEVRLKWRAPAATTKP